MGRVCYNGATPSSFKDNQPNCATFDNKSNSSRKFCNLIILAASKKGIQNTRIRETLNLSTDGDSSTDTKMDRNGQKGPFFRGYLKTFLEEVPKSKFSPNWPRGLVVAMSVSLSVCLQFFSRHLIGPQIT